MEALETILKPECKYLLYGGAAHGGKSYFLRWLAIVFGIDLSRRYNIRNVPIGLFSEDYPTLKDRQISKIKYEFPEWLGKLKEDRDEGYVFQARPEFYSFKILMRNLDDPSKYASAEFPIILVEELTKNPRETFDALRFRLRYTDAVTKTIVHDVKFIGCTNPGEIGHGWVKEKWIRPNPNNPDKEQKRFFFVRSLPQDNPYTTDEYIKQLEAMPEAKRKAWLEGSWDVFEGQVLTEWNENDHIIKPFVLPKEWNRYMGFDWGTNKPFSLGWYAQDTDGRSYKYRELYMNGDEFFSKYGKPLTPKRLARLVKAINTKSDDNIIYIVADPSIWKSADFGKQAKDFNEGESVAEIMMREGLNMIKADNDRMNGLNRVREQLSIAPDGKPWLQFFSTCYHAIRTLPSLVYDKHKVEDVDTDGEDHCLSGDTLVLTDRGWLRIEDIPQAKITGYDKLVIDIVVTSNRKITCTKNHKILTVNGWKEAEKIKEGEKILSLFQEQNGSLLEGRSIDVGITTAGNLRSSKEVKDYIERYGSFTTAKFQKVFMFTTLTGIKTTIISTISRLLGKRNTLAYIPQILQKNKEKLDEGMLSSMLPQLIRKSQKKSVVDLVSWVGNARKIDKVYDLGVEHPSHMFVANGFIVHNCYDETRYYVMSRPAKTTKEQTGQVSLIKQVLERANREKEEQFNEWFS